MNSDLVGMFALPFLIFSISFLLFVYNKKKKEETFNQLPVEHQKLEHQKRDAEIVNTFTVILPLATILVLRNQGVLWTQAMFVGLLVGTVFRVLSSLSKK